jgi:hypothetical protein
MEAVQDVDSDEYLWRNMSELPQETGGLCGALKTVRPYLPWNRAAIG